MTIELTDDGTMDTVLRCSDCGAEMRYNFDPQSSGEAVDGQEEETYEDFIASCIEDATADHVCESDEDPNEPAEDDITTKDHRNFYQYGKLAFSGEMRPDGTFFMHGRGSQDAEYLTVEHAVRAYMEREQFWPNCWFISDHGNAHLMDLSEGSK